MVICTSAKNNRDWKIMQFTHFYQVIQAVAFLSPNWRSLYLLKGVP